MCFSAPASFSTASILAAIGLASLRRASSRAQLPFAAIPLLFALQQASEGFVWLGSPHGGPAPRAMPAAYAFLFVAQVVWPTWFPLAMLLLATNDQRRPGLAILLAIGGSVSAFLAFCLLWYGAQPSIVGQHVRYDEGFPHPWSELCKAGYGVATILPAFVVGIRHAWMLGVAIAIAYAVTALAYQHWMISIWCYFAALISVLVYGLLAAWDHDRTMAASLPVEGRGGAS